MTSDVDNSIQVLIAYVLTTHDVVTTVLNAVVPPSSRHRWSNDDCLEGKRKNYQVCSVQYCVQQLCTVQCTHMTRPDSYLLVRFSFSVVILRVTVYLC